MYHQTTFSGLINTRFKKETLRSIHRNIQKSKTALFTHEGILSVRMSAEEI